MEESKAPAEDGGNVKVVCRFRPVNQSELNLNGDAKICDFSENKKSVTITCSKNSGGAPIGTNKFTFDRVFDLEVTQREVYENAAKPIIEGVLKGFNGTVFAYGQTGSGKTHTMQGPDIENLEHQGIVPRMVRTVFNRINSQDGNIEYTIKVSMAEIYMERVKDLLDPTGVNLKIKQNKERGIYVQDLSERYIASEADVYDIMKTGNDNRQVASTQMNDVSSRSHSIFIMTISQNNLDDLSSKSGKLYLVDLAGSEKVAKTNVSGTQLDEAKGINKSLSTLGKVIHALTDKKITHIPYRESKLTRILTESLGGNAKTCLIITCSPSPYNELETISTLRFGTAARNIKNKPKINREYTVPELKQIITKKDKLITALKRRVKFLENFIKENGLVVPSDGDLEQLAKSLGPEVDKIITEEQEIAEEEEKENSEEEKEIGEEVEFEIPTSEQLSDLDESKVEESGPTSFVDDEQKEKAERFLKLVESNSGSKKQDQDKIIMEYLKTQELLAQEREKYNKQVDLLSNMREDQQILQSKIQKLSLEKEDLENCKESADLKMNEFKEDTENAINDLEIKGAQMVKVERELAEIKKLYITAKNKIERYEEKGTNFLAEESKQNKEFRKEVIEGDEAIRMEIKALNDQIAERDSILAQVQQNPNVGEDLKTIIEESQARLLEQEKANLATSDNPLLKKLLIDGGDAEIVPTEDSCYLTPSEISKIIEKYKETQKLLSKKKKKASKLKKENTSLQSKIASLANIDQSDLTAIADAMAEDKLEEIKETFSNEKKVIMENLQNRIQKVLDLEMEIDIQQEEYGKLENIVRSDDKGTSKMLLEYEKNIESLNLMYHQATGDAAALKVELSVSKKKMKSLTKKLEKAKGDIKKRSDENKNLRRIAQKLRDAVENENYVQNRNTFTGTTPKGIRKVVKKIRKQ